MELGNITTYRAGIQQSKAHRNIGALVNSLLVPHDLTMMQWFILGLLYDAGDTGVRITDIAKQLDTTLAFVTNHINHLEGRKLVTRSVDTQDTRVRIVALVPQARKQVKHIEAELRNGMRGTIYGNIDPQEFAIYMKVMNLLGEVGKETKSES